MNIKNVEGNRLGIFTYSSVRSFRTANDVLEKKILRRGISIAPIVAPEINDPL